MKLRKNEHFPDLVTKWFSKNPEAILCLRDIKYNIIFHPIFVLKAKKDEYDILIPALTIKRLNKSINFFKTITIVSHRSTKSNPNQNKGFFIVCSINSISEFPNIEDRNFLSFLKGQKLFLIRINPIRSSFWAGIRFGSFSWNKLPKNIPKLFKKPKFVPTWRNPKKLSEKENEILRKSHFLFIAVISKQGYIHVTPVHFVAIKNRIFLATSFASAKMRGFKESNIGVAYTYIISNNTSDFTSALTIRGSVFAYGWNFLSSIAYGLLFGPYLLFVTLRMYQKYPTTIKNFPSKQTPYRWNFIPFIGRTFIEFYLHKTKKTDSS